MSGHFEYEKLSISGGPAVKFVFSGDVATAELGKATLRAELRGDGWADLTIHDGEKTIANVAVAEVPGRNLTEAVSDVGSALLWSHWRYVQAKSGVVVVSGDVSPEQLAKLREHEAQHLHLVDADEPRDVRQRTVSMWARAAFGVDQATSIPQRGMRLVEEAIEAAQATGVPREKVAEMVEYVYARPPGDLHQELGGVGVTLLALAHAADLSADECEARELERVLSKPTKYYAERNAAKNAAGFDVTNHERNKAP